MRIDLLGTGGYHPNTHRHTSCVLLPERNLCFDAGTAFFRVPERLTGTELDLFLTHAHLDHVVGLTFPLPHLETGRITAVRVHGRAAKLAAVREHLFSRHLFPVLPEQFTWHELPEAGEVSVAGGRLAFWPQTHPGGSLGYRFTADGSSFAFCTDTAPRPVTAEQSRGADLLVHECNFADGDEELAAKTGHSTLSPVLDLARDADVGRLVLTHFDPDALDPDRPLDLSAVDTPVPVELATDGMTVEL